jgi:hypothetical protein
LWRFEESSAGLWPELLRLIFFLGCCGGECDCGTGLRLALGGGEDIDESRRVEVEVVVKVDVKVSSSGGSLGVNSGSA